MHWNQKKIKSDSNKFNHLIQDDESTKSMIKKLDSFNDFNEKHIFCYTIYHHILSENILSDKRAQAITYLHRKRYNKNGCPKNVLAFKNEPDYKLKLFLKLLCNHDDKLYEIFTQADYNDGDLIEKLPLFLAVFIAIISLIYLISN